MNKDLDAIEAMSRFGGSFVQALAKAALAADSSNYKKLEIAFPEYFEKYKNFAKDINCNS